MYRRFVLRSNQGERPHAHAMYRKVLAALRSEEKDRRAQQTTGRCLPALLGWLVNSHRHARGTGRARQRLISLLTRLAF